MYTFNLYYNIEKKEYNNYFLDKNKEAFKNDTEDVQNYLVYNITKISEINNFKMLNVHEKCLKINVRDMIQNEEFVNSIYSKNLTDFIPYSPFLLD